MKRCDVCDSTEITDTLAELGFSTPITSWYLLDDGRHRCNRCQEEIAELTMDYTMDDNEEGETGNGER